MIFNCGSCGYGLHDTEISDIKISDIGIVFTFKSGVYLLNDSGKETSKSQSCNLEINISDFDISKADEHLTIYKIYKSKIKEIEFPKFEQLLKIFGFKIIVDYYSDFDKSVLLEGYIDKYKIQLIITEIEKIKFLCLTTKK